MIFNSISCSCNFQCYKCFNYEDLIKNKPNDYYTSEDILHIIKRDGYLFDCIIFSGGEFLLNDLQSIENLIIKIKKIYENKIIIYTNGTSPERVQYLLNNNLVDGFYVDMKLPYHLMNINLDKEIFEKIIGIIPTQKIIDNILKTINIVIKHNSKYSQIRTVKYPILTNDFFYEIKLYIKNLNTKYNSQVEYKLNDFLNIDNKGDDII